MKRDKDQQLNWSEEDVRRINEIIREITTETTTTAAAAAGETNNILHLHTSKEEFRQMIAS